MSLSTAVTQTEWDAAYTHASLVAGNPHVVTKAEVGLGSVENTALSTWAGTTNVTTLGTIGTGSWNATIIPLNKGGSNAALSAVNGGVVYSTAAEFGISAAGSIGKLLRSAGAAAPTWTNSTYPSTTSTVGAVLFVSAANTILPNDYFQLSGTGNISTGSIGPTETASFEFGILNAGDRIAHIDFHASAASDYDLRIIRNAGVNGHAYITQAGTQALHLDGPSIFMSHLVATYTNGSAYVCVYDSGQIYASDAACP